MFDEINVVYSTVNRRNRRKHQCKARSNQVADNRHKAPHNNVHTENKSTGSSWVTGGVSSEAHGMPVGEASKSLEANCSNEAPGLARPPPGLMHHSHQ